MPHPNEDTPELRRWIVARIEAGQSPDELLSELIRLGMSEPTAVEMMTRTLESRLAEIKARKAVVKAGTADAAGPGAAVEPETVSVPQPLPADWPPVIRAQDRDVRVIFSLAHPRVVLFGGLLSDKECDQLVALARGRMSASHVLDMESGGTRPNEARTSSGMCFQRGETALIERIEKRIAALLRWPFEHGEALQVLRYQVGQEYRPHYDYVDPSRPGAAAFLARGGQRVASLVTYLNTPEAGGVTSFPDATLEVAATKGNAVFFSYDRPHPSTRSLHGGMPVRAGEKWVATKWLRERTHA
jgi:prolyl 4-hydroxylase